MGQMITKIYQGVFIDLSECEDFQDFSREDDFYDDFYDDGTFICAYQGLEDINALIPSSNEFGREIEEETIIVEVPKIHDVAMFYKKYKKHIDILKELNIPFTVTNGIVIYRDEIS